MVIAFPSKPWVSACTEPRSPEDIRIRGLALFAAGRPRLDDVGRYEATESVGCVTCEGICTWIILFLIEYTTRSRME